MIVNGTLNIVACYRFSARFVYALMPTNTTRISITSQLTKMPLSRVHPVIPLIKQDHLTTLFIVCMGFIAFFSFDKIYNAIRHYPVA